MSDSPIHIGNTILNASPKQVNGTIVTIGSEEFFKIANYDKMDPFFMNIVSDADLWMFISSTGALTAGRRSPDNALFPYYNDDHIHSDHELTGSKTVLLVNKNRKQFLWEPFSALYKGAYNVECNLYKNIVGNKLMFEEINHDLGIGFSYTWLNCDRFGFIKKSRIENLHSESVNINILDGIQNILPAGVERRFFLEYSTLIEGYRKNELDRSNGVALYSLSSAPTDKAEPNESLIANAVWMTGLDDRKILLSSHQVDDFRAGRPVKQEEDVQAACGAYLVQSQFELDPGREKDWWFIADLNKDHSDLVSLNGFLNQEENLSQQIEKEIEKDCEGLKRKISQADGYQLTADQLNIFRHFSNTLYNIMRGGVFDNGYWIDKADLLQYIQTANKTVYRVHASTIESFPDRLTALQLEKQLPQDADLKRLVAQYLPLIFSRRHGDPSRPWNQFSIEVKDGQGKKKLDYQGNWRDIFQNWEALAYSYPHFIESMIAKFVSASTADGYNPYRVIRDGFDWEIIDPADPWSYIGYWGDHQIIYLLKLLELSQKFAPEKLPLLLNEEMFSYANVPYRIKPYQETLKDPYNTIDFDAELNDSIDDQVEEFGTDAKLIRKSNGDVYHVNLLEKILVPVLVKLSNFIPGAGIWMNTQRPEWNDANNALVGYGVSMVTLGYLRRFVDFFENLLSLQSEKSFKVSAEVVDLFNSLDQALKGFQNYLEAPLTDEVRKDFMDLAGEAGSVYRTQIYRNGFSGDRQTLSADSLIKFLQLSKQFIDQSLSTNRRSDGLYHAYNLVHFKGPNEASIRRLYEMLEGQVAILSSGYLSIAESDQLLGAMSKSTLFREDQSSYLLYPDRKLPRFMVKNHIPQADLERFELGEVRAKLLKHKILNQDTSGQWHFNSKFQNARLLESSLLKSNAADELTEKERAAVLNLYESIFDHQSFTGRSGTMYKFEGLGSIYWHMVSKLLLAVQETIYRANNQSVEPEILSSLKAHYKDIRAGIGIHKNPDHYGAFSTDAYSHTPKNRGVQQPGMTGQVKEDIITRFGELGIEINEGQIQFNSVLLDEAELLNESKTFGYYDTQNEWQMIPLDEGMLAFTLCQVPVLLKRSDQPGIELTLSDETVVKLDGLEIGKDHSSAVFLRSGEIQKILVVFPEMI